MVFSGSVAVRKPLGPPAASPKGSDMCGLDAEYMTLRTEATVRVPKDVDPASTAPLLCAGVTTFNAIRNMRVTPGSLVAVQGLGGLGHLAVQFAAKMGYRVVALSSSADKVDFARQLGAHHYIDGSKQDTVKELQQLGGAALIVATAPNPKAVEPLIYGLEAYGTLLILSGEYSPRGCLRERDGSPGPLS